MRIGIIADPLESKMTGISSYTRHLLAALLVVDQENDYVLIHHNPRTPLPKGERVSTALLPTPFFDPHRTMTRTFAFRSALDRHHLDLVHDPVGSAVWFGTKQASVQTIHDASCFIVPEAHTWLNRFINRDLLLRSVRTVDLVITDSWASQRDIIKYLHIPESRMTVTHLAADPIFRIPEDEDAQRKAMTAVQRYGVKKQYIFSLGALVERKNIPTLIKAFMLLKDHYQLPHQLVITGERPPRGKQFAQDMSGHPDIIYTGYVSADDLPAFYSQASCFAYPSLYEGFGLPVLEAMQSGCPVITTNISSLPEVAGQAALLVQDPRNVEELATALQDVLMQQVRAQELSRLGLAQAKKFSWEKCALETLAVYRRAAAL